MLQKIKMILGISIISLLLFFLILIIFGSKFQTISTFPQTGFEKLEIEGFEKIELNNGKNKIVGIYLNNNKEKTIFYFHGNGGSINMFEDNIRNLGNLGYNVICYDYPGYGESKGSPSEKNVYEASETFWEYLINEKNIKKENIIIYGYSIGSAVAIDLAYKKNINKLIVMSPFTSRYGMGKYMLGFNLQKILFLSNSFVSEEKIKNIKADTLIIHGKKDKLIPFYMGEKIYKNSGAKKKTFIIIEEAGHNNISYNFNSKLNPYIITFLEGKKLENKITIK